MSAFLPALLMELMLVLGSVPSVSQTNPVFHKDDRLQTKVTVVKREVTLGEALLAVHHQTGVDLVAEGDLLKQSVGIAVTGRSAVDVLTEIGLVTHAHWMKRNNGYLLLSDGGGGDIAAGRTPPVEYAAKAQALLAGTLSLAQWEVLKQDRPLRLGDLNNDQRRLFMTIMVTEYQLHPDRHPSSLLSGADSELHYVHGDPPQLAIMGPRIKTDGSTAVGVFALVNLPR